MGPSPLEPCQGGVWHKHPRNPFKQFLIVFAPQASPIARQSASSFENSYKRSMEFWKTKPRFGIHPLD